MIGPKKFLSGTDVKPETAKEARALIGKRVIYLQNGDIDKSGRGIFFPRIGTIAAVCRREIAMDHPGNFMVDMGRLVEMVLAEEQES